MGFTTTIARCFRSPARVPAHARRGDLALPLALTMLAAGLATTPVNAATSPRAVLKVCTDLSVKSDQLAAQLRPLGLKQVAEANLAQKSNVIAAVAAMGLLTSHHDVDGFRQAYASGDRKTYLGILRVNGSATPDTASTTGLVWFEAPNAVLKVSDSVNKQGHANRFCELDEATDLLTALPQLKVDFAAFRDPKNINVLVGSHPMDSGGFLESATVRIVSVPALARQIGQNLALGGEPYVVQLISSYTAKGAQP